MNEPLATAAGNALEVRNAVDFLTGAHQDPRLREVTLALCAAALELTGMRRRRAARSACRGRARQRQGHRAFLARWSRCSAARPISSRTWTATSPPAPIVRDVFAPAQGIVAAIDTRGVGMAVVALGGGRRHADRHDRSRRRLRPAAGLGAKVDGQTPIAPHPCARRSMRPPTPKRRLIAAYALGDTAPSHPLIADRIAATGGA